MIDPEIVVEKLVINPDNEHPSYHGKEHHKVSDTL